LFIFFSYPIKWFNPATFYACTKPEPEFSTSDILDLSYIQSTNINKTNNHLSTVMGNNSTNINKTNNHLSTVMVNNSTNINKANNHLSTVMVNNSTNIKIVCFVDIGGIVDHHC
jgi:hypothetical protein